MTPVVQAQNPYPDCPPNTTTIWIDRQQYADPVVGPHVVQINFEQGQSWDPYESRWLTNYLAGVLEGEMGGTVETPLNAWHAMAAQTMAVAARTVAYDWCGAVVINGHRGVDDYSRQHYWPGHAAARADEYRGFVQNTLGQYLSYNGDVFDLQYRKYVGQQTYNRNPNGPHKGVFDPVSSPNEYSGTGMGVHSGNHWAEGQHNAVGCEGGAGVGCDGTSIGRWEPNLQWDYKRILAHYYTAIEFQGFPPPVPLYHRWNALTLSTPPVMPPADTLNVTVRAQNTSLDTWEDRPNDVRDHQVTYSWYLSDGSTYVGPSGGAAVPVPVQPGEDVTVTVSVDTPTSPGFYVLRWDMRRQEWDPFTQQWDWVSFSDSDWPTQDQDVEIQPFEHSVHLPLVMRQSPCELIENGGFEEGDTGWIENRPLSASHTPHTGSYSAWLGFYCNAQDYLYQTVTIPAGATPATLTYWWYIDTVIAGQLKVLLRDAEGNPITTLEITDSGSPENTWVQSTFDLTPYAGQTVQIYFEGTTSSGILGCLTSLFVDDVSLWVCD